MPLYEYRCEDCEKAFEKLARSFREEVTCPDCGSLSVEKLLSTFALAPGAASSPGTGGACCGRGGCGCGH